VSQNQPARDLERELLDGYPGLAQLLTRTATLLAWQPSAVGEQVLRRLAAAVAEVLDRRLDPEQADVHVADAVAATRAWLAAQRDEHGHAGTRSW
jgi:hypothetical protein